jgi:hypothetical protein
MTGPVRKERFRQSIRAALEESPKLYKRRVADYKVLRDVFYEEMAAAVNEALSEHRWSVKLDSLPGKREIATALTADLEALGLAIREPKTGAPAKLLAYPKLADTPRDEGAFTLETRWVDRVRTFLMEAPQDPRKLTLRSAIFKPTRTNGYTGRE